MEKSREENGRKPSGVTEAKRTLQDEASGQQGHILLRPNKIRAQKSVH